MKILAAITLLTCLLPAQPPPKDKNQLAPYYPTPPIVVDRMLQLAGLRKGEKMFDLGSGDGRIVVTAAAKFGADGTGVELNEALCRQSTAEIARRKLASRARIICGDILEQDYSSADVLAVYLLPISNSKIRPMLEKQLKKGTRVVAHDFEFDGWTPEKTENIEDDGEGRSHTLFLYRR